ncbi:MAG: GC-type dockerin domain-anchored protein [Planctomycetota bacterium]
MVGASLMFEGGSAGDHLEVVDSMVIVDAGTIGEQFWAHEGTSVAMNGGMIGRYLTIYGGAELMMTGGFLAGAELSGVDEFGPDIGLVFKRAYAEISGGHIQEFFVGGNAAVQISGGRFDQPKAEAGSVFGGFSATRGGEVHLFVSQLLIDGEVVPLAPHVSTEILQRSGSELEAVLRDGSVFELQLGGINQGSRNFVPDDALLTATRGPINPLDFDLNNIVDISDLFAFIMAFTMSPADARTDFDGNGVVNISDLFAYITAFTASP